MKGKRQKRIMEIIAKEPVRTQDELAAVLRGEGFPITQATVSRDIRELGLVKETRGDGYAYALPKGQPSLQDHSRLQRVFRDAVRKIACGENLVVVHTLPGNANSVCSLLDATGWEEILGNVAGDDTIFIAAKSKEHAEILLDKLNSLLDG